MTAETYDVIIIGAGPAGMTAAVYTSRKGLRTLIISKDIGGQVNWTTVVENYMGFREINGAELVQRFEEQMKGDNLIYKEDEIALLEREPEGTFRITGKKSGQHQGHSVVVATGKRPRMLNVPGETEFRGKGVGYCSTCDAPLYRDAPVAVIGGGNSGIQAVLELLEVGASEVYLITDEQITADQVLADRVRSAPKVRICENRRVLEIQGGRFVEALRVKELSGSEETIKVQGVFIEIGLIPNAEFLNDLVKNDRGEIQVDCRCRTNLEGVFAAGDVTDVPEKQIIIAAGEGAKAAIRCWEYLIERRVGHELIGTKA